MTIDERRKQWEKEQAQKAKEEREEKKAYERQKQEKLSDLANYTRAKSYSFIVGAVYTAFGEEEVRKMRWESFVKLPPHGNFGEVALVGDLKLFHYAGSLCLYENEENWVRIDDEVITAHTIFTAQKKLKKEMEDKTQKLDSQLFDFTQALSQERLIEIFRNQTAS